MDKQIKPWKTLSSSKALDEKWFPIRKDKVQLPSGRIVDDYFVWESPPIVVVVPVTPEGNFVLVQQYRHARKLISLQPPAGIVEPGETLEAAAKRELMEEAGYESDPVVRLGTTAPFASKMCEAEYIFLAPNARQVAQPRQDDQEETKVVVMTANEIVDELTNGQEQMNIFYSSFFLALSHLKRLTVN